MTVHRHTKNADGSYRLEVTIQYKENLQSGMALRNFAEKVNVPFVDFAATIIPLNDPGRYWTKKAGTVDITGWA